MIDKPLYLLADSRLLFQRGDNGISGRIRAELASSDPKAAYIGAPNNDNLDFYDLFKAAMQIMGVSQCRMVSSRLAAEDVAFLQGADLVVLSGGDVERGWRVIEQNGVKDLILRKRHQGSTLVRISAGAVQLGLGTLTQAALPKLLKLFGFAPFYVGAHEEAHDWYDLRALIKLSHGTVRAVGLPAGGAAIYWPDGTLEPIHRPLIELVKTGNHESEGLLLPLNHVAEPTTD